jgi:hypothetical protein
MDPMLTFRMDGKQVVQRLSGGRQTEPTGPRRAADVAGSFGSLPPRPMPSGSASAPTKFTPQAERSVIGAVVKLAAILAFFGVIVVATLYVLKAFGFIET